MLGMAVGIDYSLFYLRREREERRRGRSPQEALLHAAATSGQAVLISGATGLIPMGGMFVSGNALFTSAALPFKIMPPFFNRYAGGQSYGRHIDGAIRQLAGSVHRVSDGPEGVARRVGIEDELTVRVQRLGIGRR